MVIGLSEYIQGVITITSIITPELYDKKSHYQLTVSITKCGEFFNG